MYKITIRNYCRDVRLQLKTGGGCGDVVRGDTYHGMGVVQEMQVITTVVETASAEIFTGYSPVTS